MKEKLYLGVATSYIYTLVYVAREGQIISTYYMDNIEFNNKITTLINSLIEQYGNFLFINIFLGPAPLLSCRTTLTFFQAISFALSIPLVTQSGVSFYSYSCFDYIFIQNFTDSYLILNTKANAEEKVHSSQLSFYENSCYNIALVGRKGHACAFISATILFPNKELLALASWKDYLDNKFSDLLTIKPFFTSD